MQIKLPGDAENHIDVDKGMVIIGANGSGKTRLGVWLEDNTTDKDLAHRISAQKSLFFPGNIRPMASADKAQNAVLYGNENSQVDSKLSHRYGGKPATFPLNDYEKLLVYLLSDQNEVNQAYREKSAATQDKVPVPSTKLDKIKAIWEEVLPHRLLVIKSGEIKAKTKIENSQTYNAEEMSDGERVIFYLIGQCLSAKQNSIMIIDEPEMHLHKAIQSTLWNKIERERDDCVFVYLTHDIAFACSRTDFKKVWLESYDGENNWQLKQLTQAQGLPEELLLELYGSRRSILLIEGSAGLNESQFYQNIFENFLVKSCGSCENVISFVKALKSNNEFHHENVYGLIDRDRRNDKEVNALKEHNIFTLEVAEFENLFATPEVLKIIAERKADDDIQKLEEVRSFVFNEFNNEFNTQVQIHLQQEIKHLLNGLDLALLKENSLVDLISASVNLEDLKTKITEEFKSICDNKDYVNLLKKYNRKTIASRIGGIFELKPDELPNFVVRLSKHDDFRKKLKDAISGYLPSEFNVMLSD